MAIGEIILVPYARRSATNSRPARTGGADAGFPSFRAASCDRCSSRFPDMDIHDRQLRITAMLSACDLDLEVWPVAGSIGNRFGQRPPAVGFFGRCESQGAVRTGGVIYADSRSFANPARPCKYLHNPHVQAINCVYEKFYWCSVAPGASTVWPASRRHIATGSHRVRTIGKA